MIETSRTMIGRSQMLESTKTVLLPLPPRTRRLLVSSQGSEAFTRLQATLVKESMEPYVYVILFYYAYTTCVIIPTVLLMPNMQIAACTTKTGVTCCVKRPKASAGRGSLKKEIKWLRSFAHVRTPRLLSDTTKINSPIAVHCPVHRP